MKSHAISWMTPEETERFLKELKAPAKKDPHVVERPIELADDTRSVPVTVSADAGLNLQGL